MHTMSIIVMVSILAITKLEFYLVLNFIGALITVQNVGTTPLCECLTKIVESMVVYKHQITKHVIYMLHMDSFRLN